MIRLRNVWTRQDRAKGVLALDFPPELARDLETAARRLGGLRVTHGAANAAPSAEGFTLVACQASDPRVPAMVRRLAETSGNAPVLVMDAAVPAATLRELFLAGARDVLQGPHDAASLASALQALVRAASLPDVGRGRVVAVLKGCGGAGATTVALNLAVQFATGAPPKHAAAPTAVLDLDLQFGDTDVALDLQARTSLLDLIRTGARLDARLLDEVMVEHTSGLKLLAPAPALTPLDGLPTEQALRLVDLAAARFDRVVIDLPPAWSDWTLPVLARSDLIVLVTTPSVTGVLGAHRVLQALGAASLRQRRLLVLNRTGGLLETLDRSARVHRALEEPVGAEVTADPAVLRAADRGAPVTQAFPRSPASRALRELHRKVEDALACPAPAASALEAAE